VFLLSLRSKSDFQGLEATLLPYDPDLELALKWEHLFIPQEAWHYANMDEADLNIHGPGRPFDDNRYSLVFRNAVPNPQFQIEQAPPVLGANVNSEHQAANQLGTVGQTTHLGPPATQSFTHGYAVTEGDEGVADMSTAPHSSQ
jgi:hypothetical protein